MILTLWYNTQRLRGEVNCNFICKLANCTFVLTNKQPFLKLPSTGMRWDEGWGEIPELGNKSHLSSLAFPNEYQLFSVWKHFLRECYHQKAIILTNTYIPFISCLGNVTLLSKQQFLFSWQLLCEKIIQKIYFRWFQAQTDRKILDVGERKFAVSKQEILNLFKGLSLEIET